MGMTAPEYRAQLLALEPPGPACPREVGTVFGEFLLALADEFARIDARAAGLLRELDPRAALELLPEWERAFALPETCIALPDTLAERRANLHEKVTRIGGQSRAYYIAVAARLGFVITIDEFRPWTVDDPIDAPLYGLDWAFAWRVNAPETTRRYWTVESGVDEPLSAWGNHALECVISRLKPAHTIVLFSYGE